MSLFTNANHVPGYLSRHSDVLVPLDVNELCVGTAQRALSQLNNSSQSFMVLDVDPALPSSQPLWCSQFLKWMFWVHPDSNPENFEPVKGLGTFLRLVISLNVKYSTEYFFNYFDVYIYIINFLLLSLWFLGSILTYTVSMQFCRK